MNKTRRGIRAWARAYFISAASLLLLLFPSSNQREAGWPHKRRINRFSEESGITVKRTELEGGRAVAGDGGEGKNPT